jgi:hypothetical protein
MTQLNCHAFLNELSLEAAPVVVVQLQEGMVDLLGRILLLHFHYDDVNNYS